VRRWRFAVRCTVRITRMSPEPRGSGYNYFQQGKYEEPCRSCANPSRCGVKCTERFIRHFPSHGNLSWALFSLGKADEAEPLARLSLSMNRQLYGENHQRQRRP